MSVHYVAREDLHAVLEQLKRDNEGVTSVSFDTDGDRYIVITRDGDALRTRPAS